jgi:hypothetical protein
MNNYLVYLYKEELYDRDLYRSEAQRTMAQKIMSGGWGVAVLIPNTDRKSVPALTI